MSMHKTAIRIDEEAAAAAKEILGTSTLTDTVNEALREVVNIQRRRRLMDLLADPEVFNWDGVEDAWR